jgi:hypothetical protein
MSAPIDPAAIAPDQEVTVDLFRPEDAPGVAALFLAVYGPAYPVQTYYHPEQLIAAVEARDIIEVVARTPGGEVVGATAMYRSAPFGQIYELGAGLVIPRYRRLGLNTRMLQVLIEAAVQRYGVALIWGESVCNHPYQQQTAHGLGYLSVALEVDLMPAAAYTTEKSAIGRVAALIEHLTHRERPHAVFLPLVYDAWLREIYGWTNLQRTLQTADPAARPGGETRFDVQIFDFAQVARVAVHDLGLDFGARLDAMIDDTTRKKVSVRQVWLKLTQPAIDFAVRELRGRGFFFGGLLPRWFDDDGLLLQRCDHRPHWEGIVLHTDLGRRLGEMARADYDRGTDK